MRGTLLMALLAVGLALVLSVVLQAADPQQQPGMSEQSQQQSETEQGMTQQQKIVRSSDLIGMNVHSQDQEKLGKIENLAIDQNTGRVHYVVVSFGTTLGFGGKLVPVPWRALKTISMAKGEQAVTESYCTLNVDKNTLAKAPSFEQGQWPDFSNQKWAISINEFYRPYLAKQPSEDYKR
ncbi:MAG: PRC-barrel domain-containing protein [Thermoguttaceae bacterium]